MPAAPNAVIEGLAYPRGQFADARSGTADNGTTGPCWNRGRPGWGVAVRLDGVGIIAFVRAVLPRPAPAHDCRAGLEPPCWLDRWRRRLSLSGSSVWRLVLFGIPGWRRLGVRVARPLGLAGSSGQHQPGRTGMVPGRAPGRLVSSS